MRPPTRFAAAVVLTAACPATLAGQICLRGRPAPSCAGFVVLEFTGAARVNDKEGPSDQSGAFFYWSGGYIHNLGPRTGLGGAFKLTADSDGHRYGPVFRYRHRVDPDVSIDVAPGIFLGGKDNFVRLEFPSATADVALNYRDWFGLAVGADALRVEGSGSDWQGHAGVRFGTWLAPLATVGLGLLIAATW